MNIQKLLLVFFCCAMLVACGKPSSDIEPQRSASQAVSKVPSTQKGCHDAEVQTMAKKLVVMHMDQAMSTQSDAQRTVDAYARDLNRQSGLDATLNGVKAQYVKTGSITFTEIVELKNPLSASQAPASSASMPSLAAEPEVRIRDQFGERNASGKTNKYLFVCSAIANVSMPPEAIARIASLAKAAPGLVDVAGNRFSPRIIYATQLDKNQEFQVGMGFENRMLDMMLGVLLRGTVNSKGEIASETSK